MMKRHAKVGKNAINGIHAVEAQILAYEPEVAMNQSEPVIIPAVGQRLFILIERIQAAFVSEIAEYGTRMTAAAKSGVGIFAIRAQPKGVKHFG